MDNIIYIKNYSYVDGNNLLILEIDSSKYGYENERNFIIEIEEFNKIG